MKMGLIAQDYGLECEAVLEAKEEITLEMVVAVVRASSVMVSHLKAQPPRLSSTEAREQSAAGGGGGGDGYSGGAGGCGAGGGGSFVHTSGKNVHKKVGHSAHGTFLLEWLHP
eukprot:g48465.t1